MQYLAKLETRCGCKREMELEYCNPRLYLAMADDRQEQMLDEGRFGIGCVRTREFLLERTVGTVLYYREVL